MRRKKRIDNTRQTLLQHLSFTLDQSQDWINSYNHSVIDTNLNIIKILNVLNDEVMYCLVVLLYFLHSSCTIHLHSLFVNRAENERQLLVYIYENFWSENCQSCLSWLRSIIEILHSHRIRYCHNNYCSFGCDSSDFYNI